MNRNPKVDDLLRKKKHALDSEIQLVREIILRSNDKIEEVIKWSTPTFMYEGNIASFQLNAKEMVSLMFHNGALIKDKHGLLEGDGAQVRVARFKNANDIRKKKKALEAVINEWVSMRDKLKS